MFTLVERATDKGAACFVVASVTSSTEYRLYSTVLGYTFDVEGLKHHWHSYRW